MKLTWLSNPYLTDLGGGAHERFCFSLGEQKETDVLLITGDYCGYGGGDWSHSAGGTIGKCFPHSNKSIIFTLGFRDLGRFSYKDTASIANRLINGTSDYCNARMVASPLLHEQPLKLNANTAFVSLLGLPDFTQFNWLEEYLWLFDVTLDYRTVNPEQRREVSQRLEFEFLEDLDRRLSLARDGHAKTILIWSYFAPFERIWSVDSETTLIPKEHIRYSTNPRIGAVIAKHASQNKKIKYIVLVDGGVGSVTGSTNTFQAGNLTCLLGSRYTKNDKGQSDIAFHQIEL